MDIIRNGTWYYTSRRIARQKKRRGRGMYVGEAKRHHGTKPPMIAGIS
jgi:hypothetical protein